MSGGVATKSSACQLQESAAPQMLHPSDSLVAETIDRWREGDPPDALAFLGQHAEFDWNKSQILDLAYEEFCLRVDSSDSVAVEQFLGRFSDLKNSLRRQIEVHEFLAESPRLSAQVDENDWPKIDSRVLDFTVVEELGRGSFARVYLCTQSGLGDRQVVVKFAQGGAFEAETMGKLAHPNIMPVHSVQRDQTTSLSAICMPFRGRSTLCDMIDVAFSDGIRSQQATALAKAGSKWTEPTDRYDDEGIAGNGRTASTYVESVIHIGIQLAEALSHAHKRGVAHRDLKPSNILITPAGRPIILDFNLSADQSQWWFSGGGTLPYMSPEQIRAFLDVDANSELDRGEKAEDEDEVDARSDVYSLGVVLYELLCGRIPFGEDLTGRKLRDAGETMLQRQAAGAAAIRSHNPRVDRQVAETVEQCLNFRPQQRPAEIAEVAERLRRCLSPANRTRRWISSHKALVVLCLSSLVAAALAIGTFLLLRDPYSVRMYDAAIMDFRAERYEESVGLLNRTLQDQPLDADAIYLRAMALMKQEKFREAQEDFEAASKLEASRVRHLVGRAYCLSRMQFINEATSLYQEVLNRGHSTAEVHNNLAFCLILKKEETLASEHLDKAKSLGYSRLPIILNRTILAISNSEQTNTPIPTEVIQNMERVTTLTNANGHVYLLAARVFSIAAREDDKFADQALRMLELACRRGLPVEKNRISNDPTFAEISDNVRFQRAVRESNSKQDEPHPKRLIEPTFQPKRPS